MHLKEIQFLANQKLCYFQMLPVVKKKWRTRLRTYSAVDGYGRRSFIVRFSGNVRMRFVDLNRTLKKALNSLPKDKILDRSKLKAFADDIINVNKKNEIGLGKNRKHCGKRRKCWLPAFSPSPSIFSKAFFSRGIKSWDCVAMS